MRLCATATDVERATRVQRTVLDASRAWLDLRRAWFAPQGFEIHADQVPVLDQVVTDFRDDDRFVREAAEARALGYAGKLCIHPGQVVLANAAFVPSAAEVDRARRLLAAYEAASAAGVAAIDFEGQMVDAPLATQARRVLDLADET